MIATTVLVSVSLRGLPLRRKSWTQQVLLCSDKVIITSSRLVLYLLTFAFFTADVGEYLREVSQARLEWTTSRNKQLISNRRTHCSRPKQLRNTGSCMFI